MGDWGCSGAVVDNFYLECGMTDRELLELAAKASGVLCTVVDLSNGVPIGTNEYNEIIFDPLTDDGDALRLAVKLNLGVVTLPGRDKPASEAWHNDKWAREIWADCPYAATRRAIVRAAAEIGKGMK